MATPNERLKAARKARGWAMADLDEALHNLAIELGEEAPDIDRTRINKWEIGEHVPSARYAARLCVVFSCGPAALGLPSKPGIMRLISDINSRRRYGPAVPQGGRLHEVLRHRWPADKPLVRNLDEQARLYALRGETEPAAATRQDAERMIEGVHLLLTRTHREELERSILRSACLIAEVAGFSCQLLDERPAAFRHFAESVEFAEMAGWPEGVVMALTASARLYSGTPSLALRRLEHAAARTTPDVAPVIRAWTHGRRAEERAAVGDDLGSGQDLEVARELVWQSGEGNLFAPMSSGWLDAYEGVRAMALGDGGRAVQVCEAVLKRTDTRLLHERATRTTQLGGAYALRGDIDQAAILLTEAAHMTGRIGDRRGLELVREVRRNRIAIPRGRRAPQPVRELDAVLRSLTAV